MPIEPPPSTWVFPPAEVAGTGDVVGVGADLEPGTLLAAYRGGLFPMPLHEGRLAWWSPFHRGILPLDRLRVTRSLRRSVRRFQIRVDTAFADVMEGCGDPRRPSGWISPAMRTAYLRLHQLGWAHSVEAWSVGGTGTGGGGAEELAGGLYGVAIGGLFAGESMFHRATDASKVALVGLVERLREGGASLLDVQWSTPHLASLGVVEVSRREYVRLLAVALEQPLPAVFSG